MNSKSLTIDHRSALIRQLKQAGWRKLGKGIGWFNPAGQVALWEHDSRPGERFTLLNAARRQGLIA